MAVKSSPNQAYISPRPPPQREWIELYDGKAKQKEDHGRGEHSILRCVLLWIFTLLSQGLCEMAFSEVFTMAFALLSVTLLHLITLTILFIATVEKSWWTWGNAENTDLWHKCMYDNNTDTWLCTSATENEWLHSVQAFIVLAVVFSTVSFLVFLWELFTMSNKGLFCFTGLCQIFAGLAVFAAVLIYSFQKKEILQDPRELSMGHFGSCFVLAWVCVPLLLFIGVFHFHLRKRT